MLANAWLDISQTQLSRPIPYRHLIAWRPDGGGYTLLRGGAFIKKKDTIQKNTESYTSGTIEQTAKS